MKKLNTEYWKKLLETVAFSNGEISLYELVQKEHRHFHPGGLALPSAEDKTVTAQAYQALRMVKVQLVDHIIVSDGDFVSLADSGFFETLNRDILHF